VALGPASHRITRVQPAKKARLANTARLRSFARFPTSPNRFAGDFLRNFDPEGKFIIPILSIRKTLSCNRSYTIRFGAGREGTGTREARDSPRRADRLRGWTLTALSSEDGSLQVQLANPVQKLLNTSTELPKHFSARYEGFTVVRAATVESFNNPKLSFFTATNLL
jgi:hypothetical protein